MPELRGGSSGGPRLWLMPKLKARDAAAREGAFELGC